MTRARPAGLAARTAIALLLWAPASTAAAAQDAYIEPHLVKPAEREMRALLARYAQGPAGDAIREVLARSPDWMRGALDETLARIESDLAFHRRPANRASRAETDRLERRLRADRLQVLRLAAALQLEASGMATDVDQVGNRILVSEHAMRALDRLRADLDRAGPVPSPVRVETPPETHPPDEAEPSGRVDAADIDAFSRRWYGAAVARLQDMVEVRLGPALVARGLERYPDDADLLMASASYTETLIALYRVDASLTPPIFTADDRREWNDALAHAGRLQVRAVGTLGPASEAAVRLARVRLLQGDAAAARELLDRVLGADPPVYLRVLALMLRAAAAEAAGDLDGAGRDYTEVLRWEPDARSPAVALSRLAILRKEPADALDWADRALTGGSARDPWRDYIKGQAWRLPERLAIVASLAKQ